MADLPGSRGVYEAPEGAELVVDTADAEPEAAVEAVVEVLREEGIVG